MKIESVKTYTYTFYHAVIHDDANRIMTSNRISIMSLKPLTVTAAKLEDRLKEDNYDAKDGDDPMVLQLLRGAKVDYLIRLEHPDADGHMWVVGSEGEKAKFEGFDTPMNVASRHDTWASFEDWTPYAFISPLLKGDKVDHTPIEAKELLQLAIARMEKVAEADKGFGVTTATSRNIDELRKEGEVLQLVADQLPDDVVGGPGDASPYGGMLRRFIGDKVGGAMLDGDTARYTPVSATDFTNVGLFGDGGWNEAARVRLAHVNQPTWHSEPSDDMKALGYIGYWQFSEAAIGKREREGEGFVEISYTGYRDLRVAVKKVDSINPAGQLTIPVEVYRALTGNDPEQTMDAKEASAFSLANVVKSYDEPATERN